jgi:hypothetical protein
MVVVSWSRASFDIIPYRGFIDTRSRILHPSVTTWSYVCWPDRRTVLSVRVQHSRLFSYQRLRCLSRIKWDTVCGLFDPTDDSR